MNLMITSLLVIATSLGAIQTHAAGTPPPSTLFETFTFKQVAVFPKELFTKESTPITFYAEFDEKTKLTNKTTTPKKMAVVEFDPETGKTLRYIGAMIDDGVLGDRVKNDGVYSRKMQMTEKKAKTLHFAVVEENESGYPLQIEKNYPNQLQITVLRRPSFVEVVTQVVRKIWTRI